MPMRLLFLSKLLAEPKTSAILWYAAGDQKEAAIMSARLRAHLYCLTAECLKLDGSVQLLVALGQPLFEALLKLPVHWRARLQQQREVVPECQLVAGDTEAWAQEQRAPAVAQPGHQSAGGAGVVPANCRGAALNAKNAAIKELVKASR